MANWFAGEPKEQLAGKTAVVMGGGSGIGKATAHRCSNLFEYTAIIFGPF